MPTVFAPSAAKSDLDRHRYGSEPLMVTDLKKMARYKTYPVHSPVSVHEGKEEKRAWLLRGISDRVSVSEEIGEGD